MRKVMENVMKASFVLGLVCAGLAAGCSSDPADDGKSTGSITGKDGDGADYSELQGFSSFHPDGAAKTFNTGFDGKTEYVTPIAFFADKPPKVTFSDPSVAGLNGEILTLTKEVLPDVPAALDGKIQMLFVISKKAGETKITATAGSLTQTATLKVKGYGPNDVSIGEQRYNNGSPSCISCHANLSVHNPTVLADLSDETILGIAVEGKSLQEINAKTGKAETLKPNDGNHKWQVASEERTGLMAYLRSRPLTFQLPKNISGK